MAWLEIRTSPAHSVVQSTNHWATEHMGIAHRLYMFYMKTVSVRIHTHFITVKITSKFRMTARLSRTDLALRPLVCSKVPVISRFLKYKLCPPPFVSRVLLSWQLVDPYLYESNRKPKNDFILAECNFASSVWELYFRFQMVFIDSCALIHITIEPLFCIC